jgi:hypothetical protein
VADLSNLARQAASKPEFVASRLAAYQQVNTLEDATLAKQLGCSLDDLTHLRLCALPRPGHFEEDVERIAKHVHADATVLTQILCAS